MHENDNQDEGRMRKGGGRRGGGWGREKGGRMEGKGCDKAKMTKRNEKDRK